MTYVSITCIRIKGAALCQVLVLHAPIASQATSLAISFQTTYMNGMHYTLTAWNDRKEMLSFVHSGAHAKVLKDKVLPIVASEAYFYSFETTEGIPNWQEAADLLSSKETVRLY
ncbi:hypothetical protein MHU86_13998 [Fragilaria crotonensis]|nr:hypothetical protein MHU86_13998 [Fragilaria crotonensis]